MGNCVYIDINIGWMNRCCQNLQFDYKHALGFVFNIFPVYHLFHPVCARYLSASHYKVVSKPLQAGMRCHE